MRGVKRGKPSKLKKPGVAGRVCRRKNEKSREKDEEDVIPP